MKMPGPRARRWLARVAFVAVLAFILYTTLNPHPVVTESFDQEDKLYHALAFVALAVTMRLAFPRGAWWAQVAWALGIGIGIEVIQSFEPTRSGSVFDVMADAAGIALGWFALRLPTLRQWRGP